jgi:membrane-bound lytic murein transglycosylase C
MQPPAVFEQLRRHLPYTETRRYLVKVVNFRRQFLSFEN